MTPSISSALKICLAVDDNWYALQSWKDLLRIIITSGFEKAPQKLYELVDKDFLKFSRRICIQNTKYKLISGIRLADDLWIESNFSAPEIVKLSSKIAALCGLHLHDIKIYYAPKSEKNEIASVDKPFIPSIEFEHDSSISSG